MATRAERAAKLLERLEKGPHSFSVDFVAQATPEERAHEERARSHYRAWADSWILPELRALVPELRPKKGA